MKALAVFTDPGGTRFDWLLRRGYRHVFCCIQDETNWVMFDPRNGQPVMQAVQTADYDMASFFRLQGYMVVELEQGPPIASPIIVSNCVGLVKFILGIRAPFVQTPFQLYRHLVRA